LIDSIRFIQHAHQKVCHRLVVILSFSSWGPNIIQQPHVAAMSPSNDIDVVGSSSTFSLSRVGSKKVATVVSRKRSLVSGHGFGEKQQQHKSATLTNKSSSSKSSITSIQGKKRSRKEILANISANARKKSAGMLPIPSFKTSTSSKLGQLEAAFFGDSDDEDKEKRAAKTTKKDSVVTRDSNEKAYSAMGLADSDDDEDDDLLFSGTSPFHHTKRSSQSETPMKCGPTKHNDQSSSTISIMNACTATKDNAKSSPMEGYGSKIDANDQKHSCSANVAPIDLVSSTNQKLSRDIINSATNGEYRTNQSLPMEVAHTDIATEHIEIAHFITLHQPPISSQIIPPTDDCNAFVSSGQRNDCSLSFPRNDTHLPLAASKKRTLPPDPTDILVDQRTVYQPETKPKAKKGRPRRQKQSEPQQNQTEIVSTDVKVGDDARDLETRTAQAPLKTKRRTRKQCCALCKTCPCQKIQNSDAVTTVDLSAFSRSGVAMERALIRRIQKLEKSSESLDEQTEMVRRTLKAHRRDTWKQTKQGLQEEKGTGGYMGADSYFLPDAEVFEKQQMESISLDHDLVQRAQHRLFQNVPCKLIFLNDPCLFRIFILMLLSIFSGHDSATDNPHANDGRVERRRKSRCQRCRRNYCP
jgi:hypothetical protein